MNSETDMFPLERKADFSGADTVLPKFFLDWSIENLVLIGLVKLAELVFALILLSGRRTGGYVCGPCSPERETPVKAQGAQEPANWPE